MASVRKHGTSKNSNGGREGERESGESTDGPSFNTSVPQLSCRQEMNYDDIKKQNN